MDDTTTAADNPDAASVTQSTSEAMDEGEVRTVARTHAIVDCPKPQNNDG